MTATAESLPETLAAKTVAATIKVLPENPVYFYTFACLVFVLALLSYVFRSKPETLDKSSSSFNSFKLNYLVVYSLVIMSDWLQGPYVYILYKSYGYDTHDIATLFVAGFLSSAVFGTYVGSIADKFGRRRLGLVFCIVYIISCITKLYNVYNILMLGRILGGIATSLLFSVFVACIFYLFRDGQ